MKSFAIEGLPSELDLFSPPVVQTGITGGSKLLLNGIDIRLTLLKNKPEICVMGAAGVDAMVKFLDATLLVRRVDINPSIKLAHNKTLASHSAKYAYKRIEMQTVTLPQDYPSGYCLYAFDLTPDLSANSAHWCPQYDGNLRMELGFKTALTESVTIVFYAEYREILEVDKNRECSIVYKG
ncbi:hypothetical protein B566_EDAN016824 [Ephemera danica]|nr:hypothetical protein B566_EDAN016824 [Ephemera danica]